MPPEGQDETDLDLNEEEIQSRADEILLSVQQLAKQASDQFIQKNSKGKVISFFLIFKNNVFKQKFNVSFLDWISKEKFKRNNWLSHN